LTAFQRSDIKLVVFDIDGTLLNSNHQLDPYTLKVLTDLQSRGIPVTLSTGKTLPAVQELAHILGIQVPLIMANGSVLQYASGEMFHCSLFKKELACSILEELQKMPGDIGVFTASDIYITAKDTENIQMMMKFGKPVPLLVNSWKEISKELTNVVKIVEMDIEHIDRLKESEDHLQSVFGNNISTIKALFFANEILPQGVTKGSALKYLADKLGIHSAQIMAFGDGDNDASMLDYAGSSIAVSNATDLCKASADLIVGSNDENSPARFLDGLFRN